MVLLYMFFFLFGIFFVFCFMGFLFGFFWGGFLVDLFFFSLGSFDYSVVFVFDFLSLGFFGCVSLISSVVFFYSCMYMEGTVDSRRFSALVFLFVLSMFFLVFSGNFFLTMVGWDGLGLVSFCLVVFYNNSSSLDSGLVTVFSNRLGDVFFLLSFFFFSSGGLFSFDFICYSFSWIFLLFLFLGSITKSAQVPFSAWLPAAMAAPTPVSSLVHSSTLVTAGIYVLVRYNYLFFFVGFSFFKVFSLFTMLVAGFCACFEGDFKKIVAMSTLSQLGMMLFVLSLGLWLFCFIHMIIHAFYKSMLFLGTGSLMVQSGGSQDSRFYGSLFLNYGSSIYFFVSFFCLSGFPFFIGFYSKDSIIISSSFYEGVIFYFLFLVGCFFTVMYSFRLLWDSYVSFYKFFSCSFFVESSFFFVPVSFLFFVCWGMGGYFYWFFVVESVMMFSFFDFFVGLLLVFFGCSFYFFIRLYYFFFYYFSMISFLRWFTSSGVSFFFSKLFFYKVESSWMEVSGGRGFYGFFNRAGFFFDFLFEVSIGLLIFFSFLWLFYSF